jgi:hypothetical protein
LLSWAKNRAGARTRISADRNDGTIRFMDLSLDWVTTGGFALFSTPPILDAGRENTRGDTPTTHPYTMIDNGHFN